MEYRARAPSKMNFTIGYSLIMMVAYPTYGMMLRHIVSHSLILASDSIPIYSAYNMLFGQVMKGWIRVIENWSIVSWIVIALRKDQPIALRSTHPFYQFYSSFTENSSATYDW